MKGKQKDITVRLQYDILFLSEIKKAREKSQILQKINRNASKIDFNTELISRAYQLYKNRFKTPKMNDLAIFFLKNIEDFEFSKISSVPKKYEVQYRLFESMFDELGKVDLMRHTLRVFIIACEKNKELNDPVAEQIAILGLTHDFGKCEKIRELVYSQMNEPHNQVSAKYVSLVMKQKGYSKDSINLFYKTLYDHHSAEVKDFYIEALNECDYLARKQEEAEVMSKKLKNIGL